MLKQDWRETASIQRLRTKEAFSMKRVSGKIQFVAGVIAGGIIFGGSVAYAAGIVAHPKTAAVVIDGQVADLKGYIIEGNHYFQLRDLDGELKPSGKDFGIVWDSAGNRVIIDTDRGYDANEQYQSPAQPATPSPTPASGGYGTVYSPLHRGDVVKTAPVESSNGSVGGDYTILKGMEDKAWKTSDGTVWPNVPLPAWQPEWDVYPRVIFPEQPPVHFTGNVRGAAYDDLMVFNPYEVERMARTIYKYAKNNSRLWKNYDPASNIPIFTISVEIADDMGYNTFYPWRDWEVEKLVNSTYPEKVFRVYAYDSYNNGEFVDTEYFIK
jgi:hypothetical protein